MKPSIQSQCPTTHHLCRMHPTLALYSQIQQPDYVYIFDCSVRWLLLLVLCPRLPFPLVRHIGYWLWWWSCLLFSCCLWLVLFNYFKYSKNKGNKGHRYQYNEYFHPFSISLADFSLPNPVIASIASKSSKIDSGICSPMNISLMS